VSEIQLLDGNQDVRVSEASEYQLDELDDVVAIRP